MPPAQFYHWCEVTVKARLLNIQKPKEVVKLNEQAAIDLGSELIGDMFMFCVGATALIAEYTRQSRRSAEEKAALESRLQRIEDKGSQLEENIAKIEETISDFRKEVNQALSSRKK